MPPEDIDKTRDDASGTENSRNKSGEGLELMVRECRKEDLLYFNEIICEAFNDKFPVVFKGLTKEEYIGLMKEIHESIYDLVEIRGEFIVYLMENDRISEPVGAFRLIFPGVKPEPKGPPWKVLRKHLPFLKALRDGYLLQALSQDLGKTRDGKTLYIDAIGVKEGYRGRGIGHYILSYIEEVARKWNAGEITGTQTANTIEKLALHVINSNIGAKKLYENFGFKVVKKDRFPFTKRLFGIDFFYFMVKSLKD